MDTTVRKITLRQCQKKDSKQGEVSQVNPSIIFKIPRAPGLGSYPVPTVSSNINLPLYCSLKPLITTNSPQKYGGYGETGKDRDCLNVQMTACCLPGTPGPCISYLSEQVGLDS